MNISGFESNEMILKELGQRLKDIRIAVPMTQKELSKRSGVSLRTITNLENGGEVQTGTLLSVMRVLNLLQSINALVPEQMTRPSDIMLLGKKRKRASTKSIQNNSNASWKWGDER